MIQPQLQQIARPGRKGDEEGEKQTKQTLLSAGTYQTDMNKVKMYHLNYHWKID